MASRELLNDFLRSRSASDEEGQAVALQALRSYEQLIFSMIFNCISTCVGKVIKEVKWKRI